MPKFNIWSEGYSVTGQSSGAILVAEAVEGDDFKDACQKHFVGEVHEYYFNPEKLSYWGCRLYDNEAEARKAFG
jgi:hypothetical protein